MTISVYRHSMLALPNELLLELLYKLCTGTRDDLHSLRCWPLVCKRFAQIVEQCRKDIIEYYTVIAVENEGNDIYYSFCGELHRDNDLPAVVEAGCSQQWYQFGKSHRDDDKPAIIYANGTQVWYCRGIRHRGNGKPAIVRDDGSRTWYVNGKLHRDNGQPAVIWSCGGQEWWTHGQYMG
jgi:hypothetical protein